MFFPLERALAHAALSLGLLFCLYLAWLPLDISLSHFGFEDIFYYLRVAQSLVHGSGATLDGIHPTNGFHPLWMLICAGLVAGFAPASEVPAHLAFSLCALFHVMTAWLIYRLVLRTGNRWAALAALFLWLFNYNVIEIAMCGLETALFGLLLIGALAYYLSRREDLSVGEGMAVGLMLAFTTLARFDGALFGLAVAADQLHLWMRKKEEVIRLSERVAPLATAALFPMIPWLIWSSRISQTILPNSHRALKLWIGTETAGGGNLLQRWLNMTLRYAPEAAKIYGITPLWPLSLLAMALLGVALFRKQRPARPGLPVLLFIIYPIAHASYYAANYAPLNRYLYPAHLIAFTGIVVAAGTLIGERRREPMVRAAAVAMAAAMFINMTLSGAASWREGRGSAGTHSLHWTMYTEAAPWIRENIPADAKIGSFNCGIYSYFTERTVINLDGVINDSVIPALEERTLFTYLQDEGIQYVVDWETMLDFAFTRYGGLDDYRSRFTIVKTFVQPWGPQKGARLLVLQLKD